MSDSVIRKRRWLSFASVLLLAACASPATPEGDGSCVQPAAINDACVPSPTELRSSRAREAPSGVDEPALARSNVAFALALHAAATRPETNTVLSPYSVAIALAMTRAGAVGATAAEMDTALRSSLPPERLHAAFNAAALALAERPAQAAQADPEPTVPRPALVLTVVNDLWAQRGLSVAPAFLDTLAADYGAGVRLADFADPEASRATINGRISSLTQGRIPTLIPQGQITTSTRVVLTNAVYFNARWAARFNPDFTRDADFTRPDGSVVAAPMMAHPTMQQLAYARGAGWQAVELPYVGDRLAMLVVMPDANALADFERGLDVTRYESIVGALETRLVQLHLPRFSVRLPTLLSSALQGMGMRLAFTDAADFSGLSTTERLKVSEVVHEGFLEVTEAGTEAAAATAVVLVDSGIPHDPVMLDVNRPFYYFVRDRGTGALLFMGRVVDPTR